MSESGGGGEADGRGLCVGVRTLPLTEGDGEPHSIASASCCPQTAGRKARSPEVAGGLCGST